MKIEKKNHYDGSPYWTVLVHPNELVVASGKTLPYSTWIGTIDVHGKINVWTPAASTPRGYKDAALLLLERVRAELAEKGEIVVRAHRVGKHRGRRG